MIKRPDLAKEIIRAAKSSGLPVSVKTRIGYNEESMDEWLPALLEEEPVALTVHLRTRKEMSKVDAHWDLMPKAVSLRDRYSPQTLILGNGDVKDMEDGRRKIKESGADGVMFGRAIFGTPWLFTGRTGVPPRERLEALQKLSQYFSELTPPKSYHLLKKHVKAFVTGFDGAAELRAELMETSSHDELVAVIGKALV